MSISSSGVPGGTAQLIAQHNGQEDLTIKEIVHRIHREVIKEVFKEAIGERISDERQKLETIGEKISEGTHRLGSAGERISDGPDRRRDHDGKIISESLHRGRETVKKTSEALPGSGLIREKVREGGTLLRSFSAKIRKKR